MELRHLRYFLAVAEERHFGRAAARLHMAQPPLSQQIKRLEDEIGAQLLARTTRHVEPTPAGLAFADRARAILAEVDAAAAEARSIAQGSAGSIRIGFVGSASYQVMPQVARAIRTALPDVEIVLSGEMLTPAQTAALLHGTIDLGVLRGPVDAPELAVLPLADEPLIAALPDPHPLASAESLDLRDLAGSRFVGYPGGRRSVVHAAVTEACARAGFSPDIAIEAAETATIVSLVAAGAGVALLPESVRHLTIPGVRYVPLTPAPPLVRLAAAWRKDDASPLLARVLDVVRGLFPAEQRDV
ncbi:LysR family transcriptional regulator [Cumulibacter manganitolerans]|uniref:LysR family transcriptional regulator n=1 Tax=Cumulibacter manganitolerans TaxID=1884992 RepID=UPI0012964DEE|nr:LysR family transcriptional regulator [Cumulibacter manganitolerans]